MRSFRVLAVPALVALVLAPGVADAQRGRYSYRSERCCDGMPARQLSMTVGVLDYDFQDKNFPMAGLRAEWRLSRHVRSEIGMSYALAETERVTLDGQTEDVYSSLIGLTVGLQAEMQLPVIRPYIGIAAGFFGRLDDEEDGQRFIRPTHQIPVGLRLPITSRIGLRGEVRYRLDQHDGGISAENVEKTFGLTMAF
jgi:hypothetical protein